MVTKMDVYQEMILRKKRTATTCWVTCSKRSMTMTFGQARISWRATTSLIPYQERMRQTNKTAALRHFQSWLGQSMAAIFQFRGFLAVCPYGMRKLGTVVWCNARCICTNVQKSRETTHRVRWIWSRTPSCIFFHFHVSFEHRLEGTLKLKWGWRFAKFRTEFCAFCSHFFGNKSSLCRYQDRRCLEPVCTHMFVAADLVSKRWFYCNAFETFRKLPKKQIQGY